MAGAVGAILWLSDFDEAFRMRTPPKHTRRGSSPHRAMAAETPASSITERERRFVEHYMGEAAGNATKLKDRVRASELLRKSQADFVEAHGRSVASTSAVGNVGCGGGI
jgi:hypothetical protein